MPDFDLAVIGAGAAGLSVAAGAAQLGARVALVERGRFGGDCLHTGCVPSKALLAAAHTARAVRSAARFGLTPREPEIDWPGLRAHIQGVIAAIAPADSATRFRALGATVIRGEARFLDPATITIGHGRLTARHYVIAAGSRASVPEVVGSVPHWTNETLFDLAERPDHLLILGGGPMGLEMADAFCGLGCAVTVIEAAHIAPREDPELVAGLRAALTANGVSFEEDAHITAITAGPTVILRDGRRISGSHLLTGVGRVPNLESLELQAGGVQADRRGIATDRGLRSLSNRRVFAVGDIANPEGIGPRPFTHVAAYHAGIVIRRALFRLPAQLDYTALPRVTYTDPELAQVGLTEHEARAAGHGVNVLRWPLADNDRAIAERDTGGLVKLVVRRGRIIGAGILARHAGEMIGQWGLAIARRTPLAALAGQIMPYPTRSEAAKRAAGSFYAPRLLSPRTRSIVRLLARLP